MPGPGVLTANAHETLEYVQIEFIRSEAQQIARRPGDDSLRRTGRTAQELSDFGDIDMHGRHRSAGRVLSPDFHDDLISADHLPRPDEEQGKDASTFGALINELSPSSVILSGPRI